MADIHTLSDDHAQWSQATFGPDTERGPIGPLKHLQKEAQEAIDEPGDIMEFADCILLLLDAVRIAGHGLDELVNAADRKLHTVLKARKYPKPKNGEPSFHVKEPEWRSDLPENVVRMRLCRMNGEDLILCEPVRFTNGRPAVDTTLRRAAISGAVGLVGKTGDWWTDLLDENGDREETIALDADSYRVLKNKWI